MKMNLLTFANCITTLMRDPAGATGILSPVKGLKIPYRIEEGNMKDSVWDSVYLNADDHCGNRIGGVRAFAKMVEQFLHNQEVAKKLLIVNSFFEVKEEHRKYVIAAIENLGMEHVVTGNNNNLDMQTSDLYTICYAAWEHLCDGYGEDKGKQVLIEEINHALTYVD